MAFQKACSEGSKKHVHFYFSHMGISMWSRQVDSATSSEFDETFRVCREFCAEHFGNKVFKFWFYFDKNIGEILKMGFHFLQKIKLHFFRKIDDNSFLSTRIMKPMTYSDSSWKTAPESLGIEKKFTNFYVTL
jgi:hypothetical protein